MKLLDTHDSLQEQMFYFLMLRAGQYSLLPELLEVVGKERMLELLKLFAGNTLQFPSLNELSRYAKEVNIFFRIHKVRHNEHHRAAVVRDLADEYMVEENMINRIYQKVARIVSDSTGAKT
jgi:hypothetical protein